jgi:hypothetical protein
MSTSKILSMRTRGTTTKRGFPVKAGAAILQNQHLEISTGYARPWPSTPALGLISGGVSLESQDNSAGVNGDLWVEAECGEFLFPLGAFVASSVGEMAYGVDEASAQPTNAVGTLSPIGRVTGVTLTTDARVLMGEVPGAWICVGDLDDAVHKFPIRIVKTVTEADLAAAATSQVITLGGVLPAGARLLAWSIGEGTLTLFSGGGATSATVALGTGSSGTAICTATSIFTGASGFPKMGTAGASGFRGAPLGGAQLQATFGSDVNVAALTAGTVDITILVDFPGT